MSVRNSYRRRHRAKSRRAASLPIVDETSAGGLVVKVEDRQAFVALIARRNRNGNIEWCLPKGHLEPGETAQQAARREIFEETGIKGKVIAPLISIDYWFAGAGRRIHKVVHHYLLEATGGAITVDNDPDHEAEAAAWVPLDMVSKALVYPNERKVVATALELLEIED